jgi:rod shape-determining protein MreC
MESFFSRYRNLVVLLSLLLVQIIGLAVQVRHTGAGTNTLDQPDGPGVRLIRLWADALVSPAERLIHGTGQMFGNAWSGVIDLHNARKENKELQATIDRLRLEQAALLEDARQGQRLQALMNFEEKYIYSTEPAQAYGSSGSDQSHVFYIDKGSLDHLARDMAVITPEGIVGKVREVFPHSAQVLAINDPTSGAGVILETTRIRGILRGNVSGQLQIVGILADQRIKPGEKVLTAGGDQIFPRGLPVGEVEKVIPEPENNAFVLIMIKPAAHLERLDEVLVITGTAPAMSAQQKQDIATSQDLKGAEAEAAADAERRKASQIMAERLPGLTDPNAPTNPPTGLANPDAPRALKPPIVLETVPKPLKPEHPDRYTPGMAVTPDTAATPKTGAAANSAKPPAKPKVPADGQAPAASPSRPKPAIPPADSAAPAAPANPDSKPQRNR